MASADRKAPVVFLTGAGASAPLDYPVTSEFFKGILEANCEPTEHVPPLGDEAKQMLRAAVVFSHSTDYDPNKCDIELVLSALAMAASRAQENKWAHFVHRAQTVERTTEDLRRHIRPFQENWDKSHSHALEAYEWLVERIWDAYGGRLIGNELDTTRDQDGVRTLKLYGPLFLSLNPGVEMGVVQEVPMFTLNYDLSIDRMLCNKGCGQNILESLGVTGKELAVDNAFVEDRTLTGQYFWDPTGSALPPSSDLTVSVFYRKLHGSLDWYRQRITGGERIQCYQRQDTYVRGREPVLMHPIPVKVKASESPFWEMYKELSARLAEARLCIVIGCSLRDPSVVDALNAAYDDHRVELRTVLVTPDELKENTELREFLKTHGVRAIHLQCRFGEDDCYKKIDVEIAKALQP